MNHQNNGKNCTFQEPVNNKVLAFLRINRITSWIANRIGIYYLIYNLLTSLDTFLDTVA